MATRQESPMELVYFNPSTDEEKSCQNEGKEAHTILHQEAYGIHVLGESSKPFHYEKLPEGIYHSIRFSSDTDAISKWLSSISKHVDEFRCKAYISLSESLSGLTALHLACLCNGPRVIKLLLQNGADVTAVDELGRNALHYLCLSNSLQSTMEAFDMIRERIDSNASLHQLVNARDSKYGRTPLLEACLSNKTTLATSLIRNLNADVNVVDFALMSPLHCVCASPADDMDPLFDLLMKKQLHISTRDSQGRTPFLVACEHNKPSLAKKLLNAGSDVYAEDNNQQTALHYLSASNSESIEELMKIITKQTLSRNSVSTSEGFEEHDGPMSMAVDFINKKDASGRTPLKIALNHRNIKNALILIDSRANIKITLEDGRTPLQYACECRNPNIQLAISLINHGADITVQVFSDGATPLLHFACRENSADFVDCLLKHGADVMQKDVNQRRPIYYTQSSSIHRLLIKAGAIDSGQRDPKLLDISCRKGLTNRAIYLIEHSKQLAKAKHLHWAVKYNYKGIALALMKHPNWYQFLRHSEVGEDNVPTTPFRELVKKMPDVAELVLDKCIVSDPKFQDPGDSNYSFIMNYEFLEDFADPTNKIEDENDEILKAHTLQYSKKDKKALDLPDFCGHDCSYESLDKVPQKAFSTKWGPVGFSRSNHVLSVMVKHGRESLLSHPVVSSLLHYKWSTYGHYGYYVNLLTFCLFVLSLNVYALLLDSPLSRLCMAVHEGNLDTFTNLTEHDSNHTFRNICDLENTKRERIVIYVTAVLASIFALFRLTYETYYIILRDHDYMDVLSYAVRLFLYVMSILFSATAYVAECQCVARWQWQCGVVAVFLSWISLMIFIAKFPLTGIYVIMLIRVFYTFLKVVLLTCLLVVAFGLSLYMALSEPHIRRSPFSTPARALLKVATMTTGELDFDELFRQDASGEKEGVKEVPFEEVSFIFWILFVVIMPILLTNMLVGLAVGDIDTIQKAASLRKLALQVNQVLAVEKALRRRPFKKIYSLAWKKIYPNSPCTSISTLEWSKLHKKGRLWKKLLKKVEYQVWGGERYDNLKTLSSKLQADDEDGTKLDEIATSAAVAELDIEVRKSKDEIKASLEDLATQIDELKSHLLMLHQSAKFHGQH